MTYGKNCRMKMIINYTFKFTRSLKKLSKEEASKFTKKVSIFELNHSHPLLKTHKLKGKLKNYWSFSINYSQRVLFIFENENEVTFIDIGTHRIYK